MVKVDLIYSGYLNEPNGASRFVKMMSEQRDLFAHNDIELRVITPDLFSKKEFKDGSVETPSMLKRIIRIWSKYSVIVTVMRIKNAYSSPANRIIDFYERMNDKGSVIAFQESFTAYHFLKRRGHKDQKVLLTLHNNGEMWTMIAQSMPKINSFLLRRFRNSFEKTLFSGCDMIGFVADLPRNHFCSLYPYSSNNTFYSYNGIEPTSIVKRERSNTLDLVCVGSISERKNQIGILNAIALLPKDVQKRITFRIVGDGPSIPELKVKANELSTKVFFAGSSNEVDKHLQMSNCFILFSKDEGLPISIIEGMRSGLPVIGTRIAGIPEQIIDGKTGYIVDVDEKELANKLCYLTENLDLLEEMGKASYKLFLEKFTIHSMVKKYSEIYKSC